MTKLLESAAQNASSSSECRPAQPQFDTGWTCARCKKEQLALSDDLTSGVVKTGVFVLDDPLESKVSQISNASVHIENDVTSVDDDGRIFKRLAAAEARLQELSKLSKCIFVY